MSSDDAERWIVNLIRNAKLDAKIDAKEVCVHLRCYTCIDAKEVYICVHLCCINNGED